MEDEEFPTLEQDLAAINQRASEAKALAALPPQMGAGGGNPMASRVQGAAEGLTDSPIGTWGKALESTVGWVKNLPKNFGLGVLDATTNAAKMAFDVAEMTHPTAGAGAEAAKGAPSPAELRASNDGPVDPFAEVLNSEIPAAYEAWRGSLRDDDSMADSLTQGLAQFAVPFTGFTKALGGGLKAGWLTNVIAGVGADAATSAVAFDPHAGRLADLIELGRHSEGKLGDALRVAAPDGSLVNRYVDWMTSRENEGEMEGRFKNAVDGTVASLAVAGFIKAAAGTLKTARTLPEKFMENVANAPGKGRMAKQRGQLKLELEKSEPRVATLGNVSDEATDSVLDGEFVVPGSQIITLKSKGKPTGFIAFNDLDEGTLQINRTKVSDEHRGKGMGKRLLLQALEYAASRGKSLVSDNTVTVAQLHVYNSLEKAGKIKVAYSDPEAVQAALTGRDARVPVKGPKGKPVVTSIELVRGE